MHHHQEVRAGLADGDAEAADFLRQARFRRRDAVLHQHLRLVGVDALAEHHRHHQPAIAGVVDEAGQEGTATQTITIGSGAPTPSFTLVVTNPGTHTVQADGSASTAAGGATVTGYTYSWGDGTSTAGGAIQSHAYGAAGTYPVTLTVTDSLGRSGASTATSVIVP